MTCVITVYVKYVCCISLGVSGARTGTGRACQGKAGAGRASESFGR